MNTQELYRPEVQTKLFDLDHVENKYATGIVAYGNKARTDLESEYAGYLLLRGNVYAYQEHYMPIEDLNPDGTETDAEDNRSVHFSVIENSTNSIGKVVGAMRLIVKSEEDSRPLPVEVHYPEAFSGCDVPFAGIEVSRLIGPGLIKWLLFAAGLNYANEFSLGPVLAVVKDSLADALDSIGVPVIRLAPAKFVEEYNSSKLPIQVNIEELSKTLNREKSEVVNELKNVSEDFAYSGLLNETDL